MVLVKFRVISNAMNFRQTIQRIFNFTYILDVHFCRQNLETLDISHAFLPLTVAKLSTLKKVRFLAHPVCLQIIWLSQL